MEPVKCFIPETLEEALRIRKETGATVLAGGSDLMVANSMGAGVTPAFKGDVLIITNLKELKGIRALPDGSVEIGACTTSAEIARSPIAPELLKDAASRMGAIALRNSATIGGNIGNASPKGDMPQPLILMDAEVVLTSVDGERRMLVDDYIIATKKTALREDEIACRAMGLNHVLVKLSAFMLGASTAGLAGVFFASYQGFVNPSSFNFFESALILAIVVLGGMGSTVGVVIAAFVLTVAPELLRSFADIRVLLLGILMVVMMIWRPRGLIRISRVGFAPRKGVAP